MWNDLPDKLLDKIVESVERLSGKWGLMKFSLVCRSWNLSVKRSSKWKSFSLTVENENRYSMNNFDDFSPECYGENRIIESITLTNRQVERLLENELFSFDHLTRLDLSKMFINFDNLHHLLINTSMNLLSLCLNFQYFQKGPNIHTSQLFLERLLLNEKSNEFFRKLEKFYVKNVCDTKKHSNYGNDKEKFFRNDDSSLAAFVFFIIQQSQYSLRSFGVKCIDPNLLDRILSIISKNLSILLINDVEDIDSIIENFSERLSHLKSLEITKCDIKLNESLLSLSMVCEELETLQIGKMTSINQKHLTSFPSLKYLRLHYFDKVNLDHDELNTTLKQSRNERINKHEFFRLPINLKRIEYLHHLHFQSFNDRNLFELENRHDDNENEMDDVNLRKKRRRKSRMCCSYMKCRKFIEENWTYFGKEETNDGIDNETVISQSTSRNDDLSNHIMGENRKRRNLSTIGSDGSRSDGTFSDGSDSLTEYQETEFGRVSTFLLYNLTGIYDNSIIYFTALISEYDDNDMDLKPFIIQTNRSLILEIPHHVFGQLFNDRPSTIEDKTYILKLENVLLLHLNHDRYPIKYSSLDDLGDLNFQDWCFRQLEVLSIHSHNYQSQLKHCLFFAQLIMDLSNENELKVFLCRRSNSIFTLYQFPLNRVHRWSNLLRHLDLLGIYVSPFSLATLVSVSAKCLESLKFGYGWHTRKCERRSCLVCREKKTKKILRYQFDMQPLLCALIGENYFERKQMKLNRLMNLKVNRTTNNELEMNDEELNYQFAIFTKNATVKLKCLYVMYDSYELVNNFNDSSWKFSVNDLNKKCGSLKDIHLLMLSLDEISYHQQRRLDLIDSNSFSGVLLHSRLTDIVNWNINIFYHPSKIHKPFNIHLCCLQNSNSSSTFLQNNQTTTTISDNLISESNSITTTTMNDDLIRKLNSTTTTTTIESHSTITTTQSKSSNSISTVNDNFNSLPTTTTMNDNSMIINHNQLLTCPLSTKSQSSTTMTNTINAYKHITHRHCYPPIIPPPFDFHSNFYKFF
ncbi:hypothetical protein SNEBB_005699 [Seison nebaliae]|nr:hypothetical protein SNEBB_005699 [Seison nebaliae]